MKNKKASSCHIESNPVIKGPCDSTVYRHLGDFRWRGIADFPYKISGNEWSDIMRRVIIGAHGESTKFEVRYFEIGPGGNSSLEKHRHEHVVICVRGMGSVQIDNQISRMKFMDVAYIAPRSPHQLRNPYKKPFGFLCIVNSKRDKPVLLTK